MARMQATTYQVGCTTRGLDAPSLFTGVTHRGPNASGNLPGFSDFHTPAWTRQFEVHHAAETSLRPHVPQTTAHDPSPGDKTQSLSLPPDGVRGRLSISDTSSFLILYANPFKWNPTQKRNELFRHSKYISTCLMK